LVSIRFLICSLSSQCVPLRVFPIAPPFNPIGFAQSPPLFTYIAGGPKRKDTPSFNLIFYFGGASIVSTIFIFFSSFAMDQSNWLIAKK
jgi:hypothetical protein